LLCSSRSISSSFRREWEEIKKYYHNKKGAKEEGQTKVETTVHCRNNTIAWNYFIFVLLVDFYLPVLPPDFDLSTPTKSENAFARFSL
jgi:hypothetical protein